MFYHQNCEKKDVNGRHLIYCFAKDNGVIREDNAGMGYLGYRCFIRILQLIVHGHQQLII